MSEVRKQPESDESVGEIRHNFEKKRSQQLNFYIGSLFFHAQSLKVLNNITTDLARTLSLTYRTQLQINQLKNEHKGQARSACNSIEAELESEDTYFTFIFRQPLDLRQSVAGPSATVGKVNAFSANSADIFDRSECGDHLDGLILSDKSTGEYLILEDIADLVRVKLVPKITII